MKMPRIPPFKVFLTLWSGALAKTFQTTESIKE